MVLHFVTSFLVPLQLSHSTVTELTVIYEYLCLQKMSMMLCGFGWRKESHMNALSVPSILR